MNGDIKMEKEEVIRLGNAREWQILHHIAQGKDDTTLEPPLTEEERPFYEVHKKQYDECIDKLPEGKTFMFVPVNDPDIHW
jgi:hypothetical protein